MTLISIGSRVTRESSCRSEEADHLPDLCAKIFANLHDALLNDLFHILIDVGKVFLRIRKEAEGTCEFTVGR